MEQTQSPLPNKGVAVKQLNFYDALKEVMNSKKMTRQEWNDKECYGLLNETRLRLHKADGKLYEWNLTDGDILGTDWIII